MKSVLLISATEASFFHTPKTVALLQDNGFDVTVASDLEPVIKNASLITGKKTLSMMSDYSGFDAVLVAPHDVKNALPKTDAPLIVAPFLSGKAKSPSLKNAVVLQANENMSLGRLGKGESPLQSSA